MMQSLVLKVIHDTTFFSKLITLKKHRRVSVGRAHTLTEPARLNSAVHGALGSSTFITPL